MTIRPDEAMSRLYPPPAAAAAVADAPGGELGAEHDISGRLVVALDSVSAAARGLAAARERDRISFEECHPADIAAVQTTGGTAGFITDERWQPRKGWAWQVVLLTVVFGAGGTSAILYQTADASGTTANNALQDFLPDTIGISTWEPKGLILLPGHQLGLLSAGGGATMRGKAIEIDLNRLADYLM